MTKAEHIYYIAGTNIPISWGPLGERNKKMGHYSDSYEHDENEKIKNYDPFKGITAEKLRIKNKELLEKQKQVFDKNNKQAVLNRKIELDKLIGKILLIVKDYNNRIGLQYVLLDTNEKFNASEIILLDLVVVEFNKKGFKANLEKGSKKQDGVFGSELVQCEFLRIDWK